MTKKSVVIRCLVARGDSDQLPQGMGKAIAAEFGVARSTPGLELKKYDDQRARGQIMDLSYSRVGNCGRPCGVLDVWEVPAVHSTSYHTWAAEAGVALTTLWDLCNCKEVRSV
ncbi:unnamed protein product [Discosporangium mesarthrocarpum]